MKRLAVILLTLIAGFSAQGARAPRVKPNYRVSREG